MTEKITENDKKILIIIGLLVWIVGWLGVLYG